MFSSLRALPAVIGAAQQQVEARTAEEARIYKDDRILYHVGSGPMFATSYVFGVCVLMEMQWMHSTALEAAEFFHGPFEVVDKDLPLVLYLGEDLSRPLMDRVVRFCKKYTERLVIYDTRDFPMVGVAPEIRPYVAPIVLCSALDRLSRKLAFGTRTRCRRAATCGAPSTDAAGGRHGAAAGRAAPDPRDRRLHGGHLRRPRRPVSGGQCAQRRRAVRAHGRADLVPWMRRRRRPGRSDRKSGARRRGGHLAPAPDGGADLLVAHPPRGGRPRLRRLAPAAARRLRSERGRPGLDRRAPPRPQLDLLNARCDLPAMRGVLAGRLRRHALLRLLGRVRRGPPRCRLAACRHRLPVQGGRGRGRLPGARALRGGAWPPGRSRSRAVPPARWL